MKTKWAGIQKRGASIWLGPLSIELFWPFLEWDKGGYGLYAKTLVNYKPKYTYNLWRWHRAFAVVVLGFGIGFAWKHCDNPNYETIWRNG